MKKYVLLYGNKKTEDNICLKNMFKNNKQINLIWSDFDYNNNIKIIVKEIEDGVKEIILAGFEGLWDKMVIGIKNKYPDVEIKVICNTQDSLLYYEYERENFFKLLELSKKNIVKDIAFLRKGQYETYKNLGYKCSYLKENYCLEKNRKIEERTKVKEKQIGIYPMNYTWDKNIFNQLCIAKFINNCNLNYNCLNPRMKEFLDIMNIKSTPEKIEITNENELIKEIAKNDVVISTAFTEYMHPIFFISMEQGIPCLIGNNSDFFNEENELKKYIVTSAEDNAIINAKMVQNILNNKEKIITMYKEWKELYNEKAEKSIESFINN